MTNAFMSVARKASAPLKAGGRDMRTLTLTVLVEGGSRAVSLGFYVAAARILLPADFGVLRYTTALGGMLFFLLQVLGRSTSRELGAVDADDTAFQRVATSSLALSVPLLAVTLAVAAGLTLSGITASASLLGLLAMLVGRAAFELYYAVARGRQMVGRMAITYLGGSVCQLAALLGLSLFGDVDVTTALIVFGLSAFVPIVVCEAWRPILAGRLLRPVDADYRRIVATARPLMVSHAFFLLWFNLDQLLVETTLGSTDSGYYGAAKTLAQLFTVLPFGINAALVPRIAQLRSRGETERADRLLKTTLWVALALTAAAAALVALLSEPLIDLLFGDDFSPAAGVLTVLGIGMVAYSGQAVISAVAVGWGRRALYTVTIAIAGTLQLVLFLTVDYSSPIAAAGFNAGSIGVGFAVALGWILLRPLSAPSSTDAG
jgi:O-antigen/teichoic acid export membrane protein